MNVLSVPRNDLDAARRFYESLSRPMTMDEWSILWRSQDNPEELELMAEDWNIESRPPPSALDLLLKPARKARNRDE